MSATHRDKLKARRARRRWKLANLRALLVAVLYGREGAPTVDRAEPLRRACGKAGW